MNHHSSENHAIDADDAPDTHGEAPLPEPETPLWLTLVGFALLIAVGVFFLAKNLRRFLSLILAAMRMPP